MWKNPRFGENVQLCANVVDSQDRGPYSGRRVVFWFDALASRSGPLLHAATLFTAHHGLEPDPPRGVAGLGELSRLIRRARESLGSDEQTREFLEGAGAYLALLLLDHWQDASHTSHAGSHRLRLGPCGTFDPFAAVAHALDADDAKRTLLAELQLAEREAEGISPTARVVAEVRRVLAERPDARITRHFDRTLWVEMHGARIEVDLGRIVEVTRDEPEMVLRSAVSRLCASIGSDAGRSSELPWSVARNLVFPRLVGPSFASAVPADSADLYLQSVGTEVWETLVVKTRERARYVRRVELAEWSKDGASPRAQALHNLAVASERARFLEHDTPHGPMVIAQSRDGLDAARLLLPGLHALLSRALGSPFLVAVPHRDTLLAAPCDPPQLVDELKRRVGSAFRSAPHAISEQLWVIRAPSSD
jgi:hypothetical protein